MSTSSESPPAGPAPPKVGDNSSRAGSLIACAIVCWIICSTAVCARFYARGRIKRVLGREDWCVLVAWLLAAGFTIGLIFECKYGMGSHIWTVTPQNFSSYMLASWVGTLFYALSLAFSKASILLLYIRLFQFHWASRAAWVMLAIVVIYNIWHFCTAMTLCVPLQAYWDPRIHGDCKPISYMWAVIGLHIATDFLIFLIPMPVVLTMTAPLKQRIGLVLIFALGFFVCLISILRVIWIKQLYSSADFMWDYVSTAYWTCVEVNGAILIPCLIVLRPLFRTLWPKIFSSDHEPINGFNDPCASSSPTRSGVRRNGWSTRSHTTEELTRKDELGMVDLESQSNREVDGVKEPQKVHVHDRA